MVIFLAVGGAVGHRSFRNWQAPADRAGERAFHKRFATRESRCAAHLQITPNSAERLPDRDPDREKPGRVPRWNGGGVLLAPKVMGAIPNEELRRPEIAAYYGIVLAGAGDYARAAGFLDLGEKASLLPEEKRSWKGPRARWLAGN